MADISESDWKMFRKLAPILLDRFCERTLGEIETVIQGQGKTKIMRDIWRYIS